MQIKKTRESIQNQQKGHIKGKEQQNINLQYTHFRELVAALESSALTPIRGHKQHLHNTHVVTSTHAPALAKYLQTRKNREEHGENAPTVYIKPTTP